MLSFLTYVRRQNRQLVLRIEVFHSTFTQGFVVFQELQSLCLLSDFKRQLLNHSVGAWHLHRRIRVVHGVVQRVETWCLLWIALESLAASGFFKIYVCVWHGLLLLLLLRACNACLTCSIEFSLQLLIVIIKQGFILIFLRCLMIYDDSSWGIIWTLVGYLHLWISYSVGRGTWGVFHSIGAIFIDVVGLLSGYGMLLLGYVMLLRSFMLMLLYPNRRLLRPWMLLLIHIWIQI